MTRKQEIERSLITKFRKDIYSKFVKAVADYELIKPDDKIMVCISGGKDSFLLAKCIEELIKHGKFKFEAKYVVMDPGYNELNRNMIEENARLLHVPLEVFTSDIFNVVDSFGGKSPCYLCARMRRGYLYNKAKELGCNKIALGHHFDDVIETTLLSMFYGAEVKTMMPKLHSDNYEGLELIRPLYLVKERSVRAWASHNSLKFINCACKFTEDTSKEDNNDSKRLEMKKLIEELREVNEDVDTNIFTALSNINLNCVLGYKKNKEEHSFLDDYDK